MLAYDKLLHRLCKVENDKIKLENKKMHEINNYNEMCEEKEAGMERNNSDFAISMVPQMTGLSHTKSAPVKMAFLNPEIAESYRGYLFKVSHLCDGMTPIDVNSFIKKKRKNVDHHNSHRNHNYFGHIKLNEVQEVERFFFVAQQNNKAFFFCIQFFVFRFFVFFVFWFSFCESATK